MPHTAHRSSLLQEAAAAEYASRAAIHVEPSTWYQGIVYRFCFSSFKKKKKDFRYMYRLVQPYVVYNLLQSPNVKSRFREIDPEI